MALFRAKGCAACHVGPDSSTTMGAPSLADAAEWAGERRPGMSARAYLIESMLAPEAFDSPERRGGPPTMPRLMLSSAEVDALVEYLLDE